MNALPLQFLLVLFAGWVNRYQCDVIEYLEEKNRIPREQPGRKRLISTQVGRAARDSQTLMSALGGFPQLSECCKNEAVKVGRNFCRTRS